MFVLRQIHPAGMTARADEATTPALASALLAGTMVYGDYLEWSDPDGNDGMGDDSWTPDISKAKRFLTFRQAMACWQAQSTKRPLRPDGHPNRPLTAYSVMPQEITSDAH